MKRAAGRGIKSRELTDELWERVKDFIRVRASPYYGMDTETAAGLPSRGRSFPLKGSLKLTDKENNDICHPGCPEI
jgi:hypothetical protein